MFRGVFSSLCLLVVLQYGAGNHVEVTSYDEIIQALLDGHHLNVVINIVECGSELPGNTTNAITSLPIKFWSWVQRSDSTTSFEFRHTFITPFDNSYNYENVAVTMTSAGSVTVEVTFFIPTTDGISNEVAYTCSLGGGVRVFDHNGGEVWDRANSYDQVKAALVSGRHVDRVINYSGCSGSPIGGNPNRIMGSNNELSYVIRNDIPREHIEFVDQEFIHLGDDSSMDIFAVTTIGNPNGDIGVRTEIWQLVTWDSDLHSILTCGYSDVVSFTLEPEEDEVEYMTYDEMVQGLLTGHELEVIFDTFDCTSIPDGGPGPHRIYIENIQQWTMGEWENGTFVRFSTNHFRNDIDPEIEFEEFDVFSDGSMIASSFIIDPASGQITARRAYQCEIGSSARLFGFDGDTTRITDFSELAQAVEMG
ncbi:unnamed protein product [Cyprideis torosa]|uniref:Uncharacterized protein n=1 Tax=Cyprideis torosa TaxID=163714 RepID=A0A7R8ZRA1_9CRUS|nr:unnamed protein product [Cyprideis torosa]CAG0898435.1 unnamed protein product [Cyprideis torosa]